MACPSDREGARESVVPSRIPKLGVDERSPRSATISSTTPTHESSDGILFRQTRRIRRRPTSIALASASRRTNRRAHDHARPKNSHVLKESSSSSHAEPSRPSTSRPSTSTTLGVDGASLTRVASSSRRVSKGEEVRRRRLRRLQVRGVSRPAHQHHLRVARLLLPDVSCFVLSLPSVPFPRPAPSRAPSSTNLASSAPARSVTPRLAAAAANASPATTACRPGLAADNIAANASASPPDRRRAITPSRHLGCATSVRKSPWRYQDRANAKTPPSRRGGERVISVRARARAPSSRIPPDPPMDATPRNTSGCAAAARSATRARRANIQSPPGPGPFFPPRSSSLARRVARRRPRRLRS